MQAVRPLKTHLETHAHPPSHSILFPVFYSFFLSPTQQKHQFPVLCPCDFRSIDKTNHDGCDDGLTLSSREDIKTLDHSLNITFLFSSSSCCRCGIDFHFLPACFGPVLSLFPTETKKTRRKRFRFNLIIYYFEIHRRFQLSQKTNIDFGSALSIDFWETAPSGCSKQATPLTVNVTTAIALIAESLRFADRSSTPF